jgi:hypothetical protein
VPILGQYFISCGVQTFCQISIEHKNTSVYPIRIHNQYEEVLLDPTQELIFFGALLKTGQNQISLPLEKGLRVRQMVKSFEMGHKYMACRWLQLLEVLAVTI